MPLELWTIGHSNRIWKEFLSLLKECRIEGLVDVRRFPTSKWSHFTAEALRRLLADEGIEYLHVEGLGGYRGGYEAYMGGREFEEALGQLISEASERRTVIMCAEKLFFRCHRRHIADAIVARGGHVYHILDSGRGQVHHALEKTTG
ncbi:MAG: DUF488 family protein [Thermoplasmata archaeon]